MIPQVKFGEVDMYATLPLPREDREIVPSRPLAPVNILKIKYIKQFQY